LSIATNTNFAILAVADFVESSLSPGRDEGLSLSISLYLSLFSLSISLLSRSLLARG